MRTRDKLGRFTLGNLSGTRFNKGNIPWNKGVYGYMGGNATSYKIGNIPPQQNPLGTVSRYVHKGRPEYYINVDWHGNRKVHNIYKWYLWEMENQQDRPEGYVIYLKNGNPDDIRTENFELITRAELVKLNGGRWGHRP